jgi:hypothetical protein
MRRLSVLERRHSHDSRWTASIRSPSALEADGAADSQPWHWEGLVLGLEQMLVQVRPRTQVLCPSSANGTAQSGERQPLEGSDEERNGDCSSK